MFNTTQTATNIPRPKLYMYANFEGFSKMCYNIYNVTKILWGCLIFNKVLEKERREREQLCL